MREALDDDEAWRQEYLCEFVDEATAFIPYELIVAAEDARLADENILLLLDPGDVFAGIGGYAKGRSDANAKHEMQLKTAEIGALANARMAERQKSAEIEGVANEYETKLRTLTDRAVAAERDLGRLRAKVRSCADMSASAASTGRPDAVAVAGANRAGSGEIDLDDVAREIVRLGTDLDAANLKIVELQALVRSYAGGALR